MSVTFLTNEEQIVYRIIDGSAVIPGMLQKPNGKTVRELVSGLSNSHMCDVVVHRLIMAADGRSIVRQHTGHEIVQVDGVNNAIVYFGDDLAPIIFDSANDKLTLDPNWVAPEPYLTESAANMLMDKKLSLPNSDGTVNHGTAGQFAVSDGNGGIAWKTLVEAEEVGY